MDLSIVRERLETGEEELSPFAVRSAHCRGRKVYEPPSPVRTEFQRDRDRIIHCNSFRRLKHKSQVFVAPQGDHYTTRLTHVIEVAQIGRTIARALNLNEDLVEAAALGHDLGHTPFGHIGEAVLEKLLPGGFHHSRHSVRIVEVLEKDGRGLNLTEEVVEAIRHHSKPQGGFLEPERVVNLTLEAQIVRLSDALAYLAHDINDALRAGFMSLSDLPGDAVGVLGETHAERVNTLVSDVVAASWDCTGETAATVPTSTFHPSGSWDPSSSRRPGEPGTRAAGGDPVAKPGRDPDPTNQLPRPWIRMSPRCGGTMTRLRGFMFESFYLPISDSREGRKAAEIVDVLYHHYLSHPEEVPEGLRDLSRRPGENRDPDVEPGRDPVANPGRDPAPTPDQQAAADWVCGMTDNYALSCAEKIRPGISGGVFEGRV